MNAGVLRRFVILMFVASLVAATAYLGFESFFTQPPGDYETKKGDIHLGIGEHEEALAWFDRALVAEPDHRGALMGRALVFIQQERYAEALAELDHLIAVLKARLEPDDATGRGALAAAHANRGIVLDRQGRYEAALESYVDALRVDDDAVSGPSLVDRILYVARPSTVRDRARYLYQQLQLPEAERVMRVPEIDARQRMHKP